MHPSAGDWYYSEARAASHRCRLKCQALSTFKDESPLGRRKVALREGRTPCSSRAALVRQRNPSSRFPPKVWGVASPLRSARRLTRESADTRVTDGDSCDGVAFTPTPASGDCKRSAAELPHRQAQMNGVVTARTGTRIQAPKETVNHRTEDLLWSCRWIHAGQKQTLCLVMLMRDHW